MLNYALLFLIMVMVMISGVIGFAGGGGPLTDFARAVFAGFMVLLIITAVVGAIRGRPPV